ncbi:hypothetical protein DPMN_079382 [Dreissena polymorpha]|uniref:Uncharacterized protein n=1 Tax=Dreissena polymorpha TaxID=45954 RepID=A0A9D4BR69_DREPO|nr:hypothetical protein DPMN_079382 [Dreissena polymorpha]
MTKAAAAQRANDVDKGWAWLVLVAVYSGIFLLSTSIFMCGVIYFALLTHYGENAAKTSVIGSLNSGLLSLLGRKPVFFSSPERSVLMVSFCDRLLSVVRRSSSTFCHVGTIKTTFIIYCPILMKLGQNICYKNT